MQTKSHVIHGLYAITPDELNTDTLLAKTEAALAGGVHVLQYRNKAADHKLQTKQARVLHALCKQYDVPLIINDSVKLCLALDAEGVHLGANDGNLQQARARLGPTKILGASCYNRMDLALAAARDGADYVAFGACFASATKPGAPVAPLHLFKESKLQITIPLVAIGGIDLFNASRAVEAGADAIAVVGALFHHKDDDLITQTAREFSKIFEQAA